MATHDIDMVRSFGQRIIYLEEGRVVRDKERIFVGDIRDRIDESSVSKDAERLSGQEITSDQEEDNRRNGR